MTDEYGEPIQPVSIEAFCETVREFADDLRESPPEGIAPDLVAAIIESLERALRAFAVSRNQEQT